MLDAELQDNMLELHDTHHWALLIGGWVGRILKWSAQVDMVKRVAAGKYNDASVCKNWKLYYNHRTSVLQQIHVELNTKLSNTEPCKCQESYQHVQLKQRLHLPVFTQHCIPLHHCSGCGNSN